MSMARVWVRALLCTTERVPLCMTRHALHEHVIVHIWIDADACPRDVKDVVFRASARLQIAVVLVANKNIAVPLSPLLSTVRVQGGPDVADDHIVQAAESGDIAVTADVPLAARLVPKGVAVLDPRGDVYDEDNSASGCRCATSWLARRRPRHRRTGRLLRATSSASRAPSISLARDSSSSPTLGVTSMVRYNPKLWMGGMREAAYPSA